MLTGRAARYAKLGQVECGFRVVDGQLTGLVERWRHGVATLGPKEIKFVSTVGGVRFLKRRPIRLVVEHVDRSEQRQATGWEIIAANPDARMVRVKTSTAMLEWAILADRVPWAIEQVTGGPVA